MNYHAWYRQWKSKLKNISALGAVRYHEENHNSLVIELAGKINSAHYDLSFLTKNVPREDMEKDNFETIKHEWFFTLKINTEIPLSQADFETVSNFLTAELGENISRSLQRKDRSGYFEFFCHFWGVFPAAEGVDHVIHHLSPLIEGKLLTIINEKRNTEVTAPGRDADLQAVGVMDLVQPEKEVSSPSTLENPQGTKSVKLNYVQWLEKFKKEIDCEDFLESVNYDETRKELRLNFSGSIDGEPCWFTLLSQDVAKEEITQPHFENRVRIWHIYFHSNWSAALDDNEFIAVVKNLIRFYPADEMSINRLVMDADNFAFSVYFQDTAPQPFALNTMLESYIEFKRRYPQEIRQRLFKNATVLQFRKAMSQSLASSTIEPREELYTQLEKENFALQMNLDQKARLVEMIYCEEFTGGPIEDLLEMQVSKIMINGPEDIFIEENCQIQKTFFNFVSASSLNKAALYLLKRYGVDTPERLEAGVYKLIYKGSEFAFNVHESAGKFYFVISAMKFHAVSLDLLTKYGSLNPEMNDFLKSVVGCRRNVLVCGSTDSGRTQFVSALAAVISPRLRILHFGPNPYHTEGSEYNYVHSQNSADLLETIGHMHPEIVVVENLKDQEVWPLVRATAENTVVCGAASRSPEDAFGKLECLAKIGKVGLDSQGVHQFLDNAFEIIVHLESLEDGSRKVSRICEAVKDRNGKLEFKDIFYFKKIGIDESRVIGEHISTGHVPQFVHQALHSKNPGITYDLSLFSRTKKAS
ncbi:MAG: Flp pilus assembly complex ATPase component TadA [Bdellovibrionales bacterium]|nr:Flp pilus assembly complex ATPase component TadA [Bdellovibrionales bacterium]